MQATTWRASSEPFWEIFSFFCLLLSFGAFCSKRRTPGFSFFVGQRQLARLLPHCLFPVSYFLFFFSFIILITNEMWRFPLPLSLCYAGLRAAGTLAQQHKQREGGREGGREKSPPAHSEKRLCRYLSWTLEWTRCTPLSHGARRRITRVDSKQRGTVGWAEPCAPHRL